MQESKAGLKMVQALALRFASELDDISEELTKAATTGQADAQELVNIMQSNIDMLNVETLPAYELESDSVYKNYLREIA